MATLNGDQFVDVLAERRVSSDLAWCSRKWSCTSCKYSQQRTPQEIKSQVLGSSHILNIVKEVSEENGLSEEEVRVMAEKIVDEMAHNFQMKAIRFFGFVLSKLMKRLYHRILVNKKGLEKVANVSSQYPILFLPTHRSYADFLLVSYICFYANLPVPVIAAGLDFLGLKSLSSLLRNSGAFFIRRSFIGDRLYWEIFSEYVKSHIQGGEFPIEFFIEGTRSRTAKSLVPKLGMLQVIMDEVFASKIPDVTIVPISISYDRTLEESLYAYELLGVPKPKESTKGLIKARKILSYDFGNVYVRFGDPISSKEYFRDYNRSVHNLYPRNMSIGVKEEQVLCRDIANYVICMHQCNLVLSPFPLMCLVIGHAFYAQGIHLTKLVDHVLWLKELMRKTGASIFTECATFPEDIENQLKLHSNVVTVSEDFMVSSKFCENDQPVHRLDKGTLRHAVPSMFIYHYGNQALQLLIHFCMVCLSLTSKTGSNKQDDVFWRYTILRKLLQREFVFERLNAKKDFLHALRALKDEGLVDIMDSDIMLLHANEEKFEFLRRLPLHFLYSYHVICQYLTKCTVAEDANCRLLAHQCQIVIEKAILSSTVDDYKCLSLDIINNCIAFLVSQGALLKEKRNNEFIIIPCVSEVTNVLFDIECFLPSPIEVDLHLERTPAPLSKL